MQENFWSMADRLRHFLHVANGIDEVTRYMNIHFLGVQVWPEGSKGRYSDSDI